MADIRLETSRMTCKLYEYERMYLKKASQDPTFIGKVKTNLVGRVLTLGVSLLLHAEAVCRAVYVCFLTIRASLSKSNKELVQKQKVECSAAYSASLKSFFASFWQRILAKESEPLKIPQVIKPPQAAIETPTKPTTQPPEQRSPAPMVIVPAPESPPSFQSPPPIVQEPPVPETQTQTPPAQAPQAAPQGVPPLVMPPIHEAHFEVPSPSLGVVVLSDRDTSPHGAALTTPTAVAPHQTPPVSQRSDVIQVVSWHETQLSPDEQAAQEIADLDPINPPGDLTILTFQEAYRLQGIREGIRKRTQGLTQDLQSLTPKEVEQNLQQELANAQTQFELNSTTIVHGVDLEHSYSSHQCEVAAETVGDYEVGICQFAKDPLTVRAETLISACNVEISGQVFPLHIIAIFDPNKCDQIGGKNHPVNKFSQFDPSIGSEASRFLKDHFLQALMKNLVEKNSDGISIDGIWNAISTTFLKLNHNFLVKNKNQKVHPSFEEVIADHGSSASVAIIFAGALWIANLGNSRAILNRGERPPMQLTHDPSPTLDKYRTRVESLGGYVQKGLVNGKLDTATAFGHLYLKGAASSRPGIVRISLDQIPADSHLFLGTSPFFKVASSSNLIDLLQQHRLLGPKLLARHCTLDVFHTNQTLKKFSPNTSLSCLILAFGKDEGIVRRNDDDDYKQSHITMSPFQSARLAADDDADPQAAPSGGSTAFASFWKRILAKEQEPPVPEPQTQTPPAQAPQAALQGVPPLVMPSIHEAHFEVPSPSLGVVALSDRDTSPHDSERDLYESPSPPSSPKT